jgi:hypothetical protein
VKVDCKRPKLGSPFGETRSPKTTSHACPGSRVSDRQFGTSTDRRSSLMFCVCVRTRQVLLRQPRPQNHCCSHSTLELFFPLAPSPPFEPNSDVHEVRAGFSPGQLDQGEHRDFSPRLAHLRIHALARFKSPPCESLTQPHSRRPLAAVGSARLRHSRVKLICGAVCDLVRRHRKVQVELRVSTHARPSHDVRPHSKRGPSQANRVRPPSPRLRPPWPDDLPQVAREHHPRTTRTLAAPRVRTRGSKPLSRWPSTHPRRPESAHHGSGAPHKAPFALSRAHGPQSNGFVASTQLKRRQMAHTHTSKTSTVASSCVWRRPSVRSLWTAPPRKPYPNYSRAHGSQRARE